MQHSHTGPSKAGLWLNCEAFREMSSLAPPEEDKHAAIEGRCCHAAAALSIDDGVFDTLPYVGNEYEGMIFTKDLAEATNLYPDYIRTQRLICIGLGGEYIQKTERRVDLTWVHPKFFGTADSMFIFLQGVTAEVVDLKMGRTLVEPDDPQLMCYALEVIHEHPHIERVALTIVQPRHPHVDGEIRTHWVTRDELMAFAQLAARMQELNYQNGRPATAGSHCCWCPASGNCDAHLQYIMALVPIHNLRPDVLTADQIDNLLRHQKQIEVFLKRVTGFGLELAKRGETFKNLKVVMSKGRSMTTDMPVDQFAKMVHRITGQTVDLDAVAPRKLGAISKIREEYGDSIAKLITKEGSETMALVPLTDKNTAIAINPMANLLDTPIPEFKK